MLGFELRQRMTLGRLPLDDGGCQRLGLRIGDGSEGGLNGPFGGLSLDDSTLQRLKVPGNFGLCDGLAQSFGVLEVTKKPSRSA